MALFISKKLTEMTERRAAFDIGSGSTKLQCAVIDTASGKIIEKLFGVERPQAYGIALQQSPDGHLSEAIQQTGVDLFLELKQIAVEKYNCIRFAAVATEVFRRAKNGADVLERLQKTTGLEITLVNQELEAELGFSSVVAESKQDPENACVWDSGGASFQITSLQSINSTDKYMVLNRYLGAVGTSIALAVLITTVKGCSMEAMGDVKAPGVINPIPSTAKEALIQAMINKLPPEEVPSWLHGRKRVTAACGNNCLFQVCCDVLYISRAVGSPITEFTRAQAEQALDICLDCTDDVLQRYQAFQYAEGVHVLVCKLVLLVAVMRHCVIQTINTVPCVGSCAGVLESKRFWL